MNNSPNKSALSTAYAFVFFFWWAQFKRKSCLAYNSDIFVLVSARFSTSSTINSCHPFRIEQCNNVMAELHLIGQLLNAVGFDDAQLFCKWSVQHGPNWTAVEGACEGTTFTSYPLLRTAGAPIAFGHPLDVHLAARGLQGWPKLHVEVYARNALGRYWPVGFGVAHVPTRPGQRRVVVHTWKVAADTWWCGGLHQRFGTGGFTLSKSDLVYSGAERYKLTTIAAGRVAFELLVVARNFEQFGVELY